MKHVAFHGGALDEIRAFPVEARRQVGFQIERLQNGLDPNDWKPMKTIGPGVREIRVAMQPGRSASFISRHLQTRSMSCMPL